MSSHSKDSSKAFSLPIDWDKQIHTQRDQSSSAEKHCEEIKKRKSSKKKKIISKFYGKKGSVIVLTFQFMSKFYWVKAVVCPFILLYFYRFADDLLVDYCICMDKSHIRNVVGSLLFNSKCHFDWKIIVTRRRYSKY